MTQDPKQQAQVVVVGSLNMDLVVRAPRLPASGETLLGGTFRTHPGGKGANQAVAAARLGARVAMVGAAGHDAFGRQLVDGLRADGIDTTAVALRNGVASGVALITVDTTGANTIVVAAGANDTVTRDDIERSKAAISGADALVMQLETPLSTVAAAARMGRAAGRCVMLNAAPAQPLPADLLALIDVLIVNETEAAIVAGCDAPPAELAARLAQLGPRLVVITLGADGALACVDGRVERHAAFPVKVVDTVAAGDAFVGAFAVARAEGRDLPTALRFACAAGALATTREGAQPSLPGRADVDRLAASVTVRPARP